MFECDIAHCRSAAVLYVLYKIKCNPMHRLNDTLPGPYVPVRVTLGELVPHRYTYSLPRGRTSQYCMIFVLLSVSLWNDLADPVFDGVVLAGFKTRAHAFFIGLSCSIHTIVFYFGLIGYISLSLNFALATSFNNNNNNNNNNINNNNNNNNNNCLLVLTTTLSMHSKCARKR